VNFLTDDRTTDLGGGPALHSNMVEVTRLPDSSRAGSRVSQGSSRAL
jgi:hypothetical protein